MRKNSSTEAEVLFLGKSLAAMYGAVYKEETDVLEREAKKVIRNRNIHPRNLDYSEVERDGLEPFLEMTLGGAAIE